MAGSVQETAVLSVRREKLLHEAWLVTLSSQSTASGVHATSYGTIAQT